MYVIVMHGGVGLFNTQYTEKYLACQEKKVVQYFLDFTLPFTSAQHTMSLTLVSYRLS
jgi:hypothetical protein